ncbi:MAG: hypothetical protein L3J35_11365 [Bacteroidales bacterium]|nr:hypothetical protein [Bacteroidales bacterium]
MKKLIITIIVLGALGTGGYYGFNWYISQQEKEIAKLEDKIHFLKEETVPLRFKILEKDSANIKFLIKFYEQDAEEAFIADTITLPGQELSFDFYVVPVKDIKNDREVKVAFPYKIFTNTMPAKNGKLLFNYYDEHGFPQVFNNAKADTAYINRMTELFAKIKAGNTEEIEGIYGSMVQDIKKLNEFAVNHVYQIIIHTKGGIEIKENTE